MEVAGSGRGGGAPWPELTAEEGGEGKKTSAAGAPGLRLSEAVGGDRGEDERKPALNDTRKKKALHVNNMRKKKTQLPLDVDPAVQIVD